MPHIIGERIVLREYRLKDIPDIRKWVNTWKLHMV